MREIKDTNSLISIVMPAYNSEKYIGEAINSVISQTYQYWELIVIDDASHDNTLKIIVEFSNQDTRIKYIQNNSNLGVSNTRNIGISQSSGDWIAFLDSDDMWEKEKLEKQIDLADRKNASLVFTGLSYINESSKAYIGNFKIPEKISYKQLRNQNVIPCSSVLIKKELLSNIKMENDDMHEDYAVWLRVLKIGITAYGINEPLLIYRYSRNSKSGNKFKAFKMTYKVFRFLGLNPISSAFFTLRHLFGSAKKYLKLLAENKFKI